jgi:hypothetical protein
MKPRLGFRLVLACCLVALACVPWTIAATTGEEAGPDVVTAGARAAILGKIDEVFRELYPDHELTERMISHLREVNARGTYDPLTDVGALTAHVVQQPENGRTDGDRGDGHGGALRRADPGSALERRRR